MLKHNDDIKENREKPSKGNPTQSEILVTKLLPFFQFFACFTAEQLDFL